MKKGIAILLCVLLIAALAVGWRNRQAGETLQGASFSTAGTQAQETAAPEEEQTLSNADEEPSATTAVFSSGESTVVREYPEYGITLHAVCPEPEAKDVPCLSAQITQTYYDSLVQNFLLARYPEVPNVGGNKWRSTRDNGDLLVSLDMSDENRVYFVDVELDISGKVIDSIGDYASFTYHYFTDLELNDPETGPYTLEEAKEDAIQVLEPYTDFQLLPCNAYVEQDSASGKSQYRIDMQLSYQGIPCCVYSEIPGQTGLDISISQNGLGYMQGVFTFEQIQETELRHVLSLDEILSAFEEQILFLDDYKDTLEIYYIQLEYYGTPGQTQGEYTFQPVWNFYGRHDGNFTYNLKLYADTGLICSYFR